MDIIQTKEKLKETNRQVVTQTLGFISSAFVLVAALAWNEAIKQLISTYLSSGSGLVSKFVYAGLVTILAVLVTVRLTKLSEKFKDQNETK